MKDLNISKLKDYYGKMLTEKQADVIGQYYDLDYSLKEISDNLAITRQAVHFALKNGVETLREIESKLGCLAKQESVIDDLEKLKNGNAAIKEKVDLIIEKIRS